MLGILLFYNFINSIGAPQYYYYFEIVLSLKLVETNYISQILKKYNIKKIILLYTQNCFNNLLTLLDINYYELSLSLKALLFYIIYYYNHNIIIYQFW
jgi:hypothetical protein